MIQIRNANYEDFDQLLVLFRQLWPAKQIVPERLRAVRTFGDVRGSRP